MSFGRQNAWLILTAAIALVGCGRSEKTSAPQFYQRIAEQPTYTFAVHPLHNPALLHTTYGPLVTHLNQTVGGATFRLISSRDYASFDRRLLSQEFDFVLTNPYQAVLAASNGYRVFGKVAGDDKFRGFILTRRGSSIKTVRDLRGKAIAYPAPTAVAATMLPQYYLHSHGLSPNQTRTVYVGSMESALLSLYSGATDAAAVGPRAWESFARRNPGEAARLQVTWVTPSLVNDALAVRSSIPRSVDSAVLRVLSQLSETPKGRTLLSNLAVQGFEPATNATYDPVGKFLRRFSAEVRPLDLPTEKRS